MYLSESALESWELKDMHIEQTINIDFLKTLFTSTPS